MVMSIYDDYAKGKNHVSNYKNRFPFFDQKACIPLPTDIVSVSYVIDKTEKLLMKVLDKVFHQKDIQFHHSMLLVVESTTGIIFYILPLEQIFK